MKYFQGKTLVWAGVIIAVVAVGYVAAASSSELKYDVNGVVEGESEQGKEINEEGEKVEIVQHLPTPEPFKAIYMTQCVAGTPSFRAQLVELIKTTELNAVVVDIKDFSGTIGFRAEDSELAEASLLECGAGDMKEFVELLHKEGIYVVGRVTVFQDPLYARRHPDQAVQRASDGGVWEDFKGLSFVDVGSRIFWDYIVTLSKEAYALGIDELNYDYIRYPSDGNLDDIAFPLSGNRLKADALEDFFAYLYEELSDEDAFPERHMPVLSADLFGYTTTNRDDLGIGQLLERTLPYFHYVMPMVYPSHYNPGFIGIDKPATQPYEVVKYSMDSAVNRARAMAQSVDSTSTSTDAISLKALAQKGHGNISPNQLRPWLQDFDLGAIYTPEMVRAQMRATYDASLTSWALWDAGNTYTKPALGVATTSE